MQETREEDLSELFKIFETSQFLKDLKKINTQEQERIYYKIINNIYPQLKKNPYFGKNIKKLRACKPETWRYRISYFRLFYEINHADKIISIITIVLRSKAY